MRSLFVLLMGLALFACGEDSGAAQDPDPGQQGADVGAQGDGAIAGGDAGAPDAAEADAADEPADAATEADAAPPPEDGVQGFVYEDRDDTDRSSYDHEYGDGDAPIADLRVRLLGADGVIETRTDADGRFEFNDLADGVYLVQPDTPAGLRCAMRNCAGRFAQAVADGQVKIVTYGDSIPVVGERPFFPGRLASLLSPLAQVDSKNVAVAGSTSPQWLPGTPNYEQRLAPEIADADLILVSIGGNDIVAYAANPARLSDIPGAIAGAIELIADIADNIVATIEAIRAVNPTVDVGFLLYVDYSRADMDQFWRIANNLLGPENIGLIFESALEVMPRDQGFVLVDLFNGSQDQDVNVLLYDQLHFNARGQTFYTEEIFKALGGVLVGDPLLRDEARSPLGLSQTWSFAAE